MKRYLKQKLNKDEKTIAYFSMEIGVDSRVPTYSGGLGILAGDTIKSAADLGVPEVAVTLLCERGYFYQKIDQDGNQIEMPVNWSKDDFIKELPEIITVKIEGREVKVKAWEYMVKGVNLYEVPIYFLDTNIEGNSDFDRGLTSHLYGGDDKYRICQEIILGIGGVRMLNALGYKNLRKYHMNEGHASFLILELLEKTKKENEADVNKKYDMDTVRDLCVFTTHTPVPAGHDKFNKDLVKSVLDSNIPFEFPDLFFSDDKLNMTLIGLNFSTYINGVAKKHGEVSRTMFPGYPIDSITNGVHHLTWTSKPFQSLFDKYIPGWRSDPYMLRSALGIPRLRIWDAHMKAKKKLIDYINREENVGMDYDVFTIGFARRATPYKRADLLFTDVQKLIDISNNVGKIQIVYGGKAHPHDGQGKELIKRIWSFKTKLGPNIKLVYLQNYDMELGRTLISGVDIWLNTPQRPREASGTSGMKATLNGVPSFSVLDGWWIEGHLEDMTGWSIGKKNDDNTIEEDDLSDAKDLYYKLEKKILPKFYKHNEAWLDIMRHVIALNGSFFNTQRMVEQYVTNAYLR